MDKVLLVAVTRRLQNSGPVQSLQPPIPAATFQGVTIKWIQGFTSFLKRKSYELKRLLLKAKSLKTRERGRGIFRESQRGRKKQGS